MLRWTDADHRNLQTRTETAITGTAPGDGGMMECTSVRPICHRFQCRHRTHADCPRPAEPAKMAGLHLDPAPCASAASGKRPRCAQPSRSWSLPIIVAAPASALFPHRRHLGPRGFVLSRFVNVDRPPRWLASRRGPRRKSFREADGWWCGSSHSDLDMRTLMPRAAIILSNRS